MKCLNCNGTGKTTITMIIVGKPDDERNGDSEIDCVWCNGTGKMTHEGVEDFEYGLEMMCKCSMVQLM